LSDQEVRDLIEQNRHLQAEVDAQQKTIGQLSSKLDAISQSSQRQNQELQDLAANQGQQPSPDSQPAPDPAHEVRLSGDLGVGFLKSGSDGQFPNGDFRVDEARLFVEAPVAGNTFLVSELDLVTREASDQNLHLGELYVDIENVSGQWGRDNLLDIKAGRFNIPFGEEYQSRYPMENPLISHSLGDLWGFDQGLELYGKTVPFSYVVSVTDGGYQSLHTDGADKSVTGRIGYDPAGWLHVSASAMRTGELSNNDLYSALWFGGGYIRSLGPTPPTTRFGANLFELDGGAHWSGGSLKAAGGFVRYDDNDPSANDLRRMSYWYVEGVQHITDSLYGAVRYSEILSPGGYPIVAQGNYGEYYFDEYTTKISRLSMGLGYQIGPPMVLKVEFSPEWGTTTSGEQRGQEDLYSTELGVKF
jgi:hypothetical protein